MALLLSAGTAMGNVFSVTNGPWNDADTWDPGIPSATDDVFVRAGDTVTISGLSTININSLSVSGVLEHAGPTSTEANRIILDITNDCTIASGGKIDVTGRGYSSGGPGVPSAAYSGGSHGGRGGLNGGGVAGAGPTYGSLAAPVNFGSAGSDSADGGGAIRLTVGGTTTVDGGILANGSYATYDGGAGGSVFVTTANFAGSGSVTANGGKNGSNAETHGAGGGGRVSVVLTSGSSFGSVGLHADRGCGTVNKGGQNGFSSGGTVYTKTPSQTYGTVKIDNSGYGLYESGDASPNLTPGTWIPSNHTWQVDKLELVNSGNLFVGEEATLNIASGDFGDSTTNGSLAVFGTIVLPPELSISNITFLPHWDCTLSGLTNLTIAAGGILKHLDNSTTEAYRLDIDIPGDFTLAAGAKIDVTGLGYNTGQGPGVPSYNYSGGSHGGRGGLSGTGISRALAGPTYGSFSSPTNCGSGGSNQGTGGGVVRITAGGTTTINGEILAEGGDGVEYDSGAGGSVYITTADLAGSGTISVNGGWISTGDHGAGGGGRLAVVLTNGSNFGSVALTAYAGGGGNYGGNSGFPSAGTIYTKVPSQAYGKVKVDNNGAGLWAGGGLTPGTYIPDGRTWQVDQVELVNGGALWIADTATLIVPDTSPSTTNGMLINEGTLSVPGDFIVTNITFMPIAGSSFSGLTNLTVANGAIVSHVDNHTAEDWKLELTVPGDLTINGGGQINIDGKGYWRGNGPAGGGNYGMGGGYGGQGGSGRDAGQGTKETYGSITSPTNIGSAGQRYTSDESDGGGAAKITVGETTTVDGMISANGKSTTTYLDGGGSGGSVWLTTSNLVGAGTIRADGGSAANASTSGGGGGRIAVHLTGSDSFGSVVMQAYGKTGNRKGAAGTVYLQTESQGANKGTLIVDNNGLVTTHGERTQISDTVTDAVVGDVIIRNSGHFEVNTNQSITVYGSWSNGYEFSAGAGGTVEFAGTNTVTVFGDNTFEKLVCTNVTKQINFEASATQDVDNVFTFSGPSDTSLVLRSTSPGTQWGLDLDGGVVMTIEYVDVQDSDARPGTSATAASSKDSGSNSNWNFSAGGIETNIWIGAVDSLWGTVGNWSLNRTPLPADERVIFSNGLNQATLPSAQVFKNLEVWAGATLSLGGFDLTVNRETIVQGTITPSGGETMTFSNLVVSGTLAAVGAQEILVAGDMDLTGGTFSESSSHVVLDGIAPQTVTSDGESFSTLTASNQSATVTFADAVTATTYYSRNGNVTYGGDFNATIFDVYSDNGAVTHTFNAGSTYTFQEMWLRGTSGKTQHLESAGTWNLDVVNVANVANVDVEYSDADPGVEIQAISSTDGGNNENWNFGPFSVWTGDTDSDFHTAGNWDPSGVPGVDSYIIVDDTDTCNVDTPATVKYAKIGGANASRMEIDSSFTVGDNVDVIANGTLEINDDPGMTVSGNVSVASGGLLTHKDNSTTEADRMILAVGGNLTVALGGEIDVTGLGYDRRQGPGTPLYTSDYSGGSHGGRGGVGYDSPTNAGPTYGSLKEPVNLGSGGSDESGATGGGAVQLTVTGTTTVDGKILAEGGDGNSYDSGAGGSVWITTGSLSGSGTISVNGGFKSTGTHGAGGGGRVAVVLTNSSSFGSVSMTAHAGGGGIYGGGQGFPAAGTIYTRIPGQAYGKVKIDNNGAGLWAGGDLTTGTWIPSNQVWQVDVLELTDAGSLWVGSEATLNIASGDFGNSSTSGNLVVEGTVVLPGNLTVSNFTLMPHWNSTLSGLTNLTIANGAMASHVPNNDDTAAYRLKIDIPGNLTIDAGGKIDVTGGGYDETEGPGAPSYQYNGGGHGGQGGLFYNDPAKYGPAGATYGSVLAPTNAGSGSGSGGPRNAGGGVARFEIGGTTTVNGLIAADGRPNTKDFNGGAGGSICLTTATLAGSGTIRADGADPYPTQGHTGAGGGGRVAVVLTSGSSFGSVEFSARGGTLGGSGASGPGTVYLEKASDREDGGTVIVDSKGEDALRAAYLPPEIPVVDEDLSEAMLVVTGVNSRVALSSNLWVRDILVYTDAYLTLGSNTLFVYSREHHIDDLSQRGPGGPTNTVTDHYGQIIWLGVRRPPGSFLLLR